MNDDTTNKLADAMKANNLLNATKTNRKKEVTVGSNEFKAMKKQNYDKNESPISYVIQNTKTGAIVEIKAVSPLLAAKTVGWRPRHVKVLQINGNQ